jgi:hypothetical protein
MGDTIESFQPDTDLETILNLLVHSQNLMNVWDNLLARGDTEDCGSVGDTTFLGP